MFDCIELHCTDCSSVLLIQELKLALSVTHDTEEALDSLKLQLEKENLPLVSNICCWTL